AASGHAGLKTGSHAAPIAPGEAFAGKPNRWCRTKKRAPASHVIGLSFTVDHTISQVIPVRNIAAHVGNCVESQVDNYRSGAIDEVTTGESNADRALAHRAPPSLREQRPHTQRRAGRADSRVHGRVWIHEPGAGRR